MRKIVLTFGLIAGAIMSVWLFASIPMEEQLLFENGMFFGYTTMVVAFLMVYFGVRSYRDNVAGGSISFGRALKVGALISLVATVFYVASWQVVYYNFVPDFGEKYAAYAVEKARREGKSEAEIAKTQQEMFAFAENYKNPLVNVAWTFVEPLPVAVVFTLLTAGVLSRRRRVDAPVTA